MSDVHPEVLVLGAYARFLLGAAMALGILAVVFRDGNQNPAGGMTGRNGRRSPSWIQGLLLSRPASVSEKRQVLRTRRSSAALTWQPTD